MKKKSQYTYLFITVCILIVLAYSFCHYYAPPKLRQPYQINVAPDDTLRIAFIGDSWAFLHKGHKCMIPQILQDSLHRHVKVHSYGLCGYTSKEIYEEMFNNNDLRAFMCKRRYDYIIISAGINDVNKKTSKKYYKDSMEGIIGFLLSNNIHPIILEIPDFDVYKIYRWWRTDKRLLRIVSMRINNVPIDCKQIFRDTLDSLLSEKGDWNKISIIKYKSWNNDYSRDLKQLYLDDGLHLNKYGYAILDSVIAKEILKQIATEHNTESPLESDADHHR